MSITAKMQEKAKELLESGTVKMVLGWEKGTFWYQSTPVFITNPADVEKLVWDEFCVPSLAKYTMNVGQDEKVAVFVKGCDSKGIVRLIQDKQLQRERVVLLGIPCSGMHIAQEGQAKTDGSKLPLEEKCKSCVNPNPVIYDELLAEQVEAKPSEEQFTKVVAIENMSPDEKYKYWTEQFSKCIRCYACRNSCPACNCRECYTDQYRVGWQNKAVNLAENQMFHITRAIHVAGRCVDCGECERVCPVGIPLMELNRKLIKDINQLFGEYSAGVDLEVTPPLGRFNTDDPEEFM